MSDQIPAELGNCHVDGEKPDMVFVSRSGYPLVLCLKDVARFESALKHAGYYYVEFSSDVKEEE